MATKRQNDLFPSTALTHSTHQGPTALAPSERSRALVKAERKIAQEAHKHQVIMEQQGRKAAVGQRAIGTLHESSTRIFSETADRIWEARTPNGRDPDVQRYIDHYAAQSIQSAGIHIQAATVMGSERILEEVGRSLYTETKESRGFLALLRGENE